MTDAAPMPENLKSNQIKSNQDGSKKESVALKAYDLAIDYERVQNLQKSFKCCNFKNNDAMKAALSGVMANDLNIPSI